MGTVTKFELRREPVLLTVKETSLLLRLNRAKIYLMIQEKLLDGCKIGADWRIKRASIEKYTGPIPNEFFLSKVAVVNKAA